MPLVNTSIPNLAQGVSQQPDNLRFAGQHEAQENMLSSVVDGLRKRPFTEFVGELGSDRDIHPDSFVHLINRDASNRHVLVIEPSGESQNPKIYDTADGSSVNLYDASTGTSTTGINPSYLQDTNPRENLRALTVADTTFILNKTQSISALGTDSDAFSKHAVVFVTQVVDAVDYTVEIDIGGTVTTCTYTTWLGSYAEVNGVQPPLTTSIGYMSSSETTSPEVVAQGIYAAIKDKIASVPIADLSVVLANEEGTSGSDYSATTNGNGVLIKYSGSSDFEVRVRTTNIPNEAIEVVYREANGISDLPAKSFHDFEVKIAGDVETAQDDYYVKFQSKDPNASTDDFGEGKWVETIAPSTATALTATDMPYKLEPQPAAQSNYYIEANTWGTRLVGDTETNPDPSFVGSTIENIFFWKNRLGFLSGQNIIFSEADEYYNFFRTTVLQLLDSAPIDVGISHTKVSNLKHVATFQEKLVVFSDETQFVIKGNELLTPKTINVTPTTEYTALAGVEPLTQGNFIYFPFPRNSYNGVNEYAIDLNTDTFRGEEITGQVPKYIPADIKQLVGSPTEDIIVATTSSSSGTTDLYVYKYFWRGNERVQSAWSRFTFQDDIVNAFFIESDLYLVTEDGTNTHLEKMSLESGLVDTGESYAIHLDKRRAVSGLSPSYDAGTDKTTIVAGYPIGPVFDFSNGGAGTGATANVTYNSSGTITAVTVNAGGSGYTDDTGYELILTGGNPTTAAIITFDVSGGAVSNFTITDGGLGYSIAEVWSQGGTKATRDVSSFGNTIVVNGDYSTDAYVGIPYTSSVTLTRPTVKQSADGNGRSVSGYSHQIVRNGSIEYANTGHFKVSVATKFRSSYEHIFNANILGADTLLGQLVLQDGTFQFPVYANVNDITVTITSESALPMQLLATEFESTVASRSRRIAT